MGCINIVVDEKTPKSTYEGITYYFCSKECKEDFDKNPSKYLKVVTPPPKGAMDPVCCMKIDEHARFVTCVYQNKVYYFCSDHCRTKYMENPESYSGKE
jgi:Cu+-exporting ATPase